MTYKINKVKNAKKIKSEIMGKIAMPAIDSK
jgi:hypothetical protein